MKGDSAGKRLMNAPKGIREEILEETKRRKKSYFRREIAEVQAILKTTDREAKAVERESEETELFVETETPEPVQAESTEAETEEPLVIETETGTSVNDREQEIQETPEKTEEEKPLSLIHI